MIRSLLLLCLVSGCTLITDPSEFDRSPDTGTDDAGEVDAGPIDSTVDTAVDASPEGGADGGDMCCTGCTELSNGARFSAPEEYWSQSGPALGMNPFRKVQLVARADESLLFRRVTAGYEVFQLPATDPQAAAMWISDNFNVECLMPGRAIDLDVQRLDDGLVVGIAQTEGITLQLSHLREENCREGRHTDTLSEGYVSAGLNGAWSRGRMPMAEDTNLLVASNGAPPARFPEVYGLAASQNIMAIAVASESAGDAIEYWEDGAPVANQAGDEISAQPQLVPTTRDSWVAIYGRGGVLVADRINVAASFSSAPVSLPDFPIGQHLAGVAIDERELILVASARGTNIELALVNAVDGGVEPVTTATTETPAVGLDIAIRPRVEGEPLTIMVAVAEARTTMSNTTVFEMRLCTPPM